jgi:inner membrane protein
LVGANLASTRLGEKTALAPAALILGANLPDVDSILYFTGHSDLALGFRRGWTHGVLALVVLPLVLTGLLLLYARLRGIAASPRWLLILSGTAILTHPGLDWLNNYGMRWLMPFRGTWTYGDSVFIMDPLLWLILGAGWLAGKRATPALVITFAVITLMLAWVVGRRSPGYLVIVGIVAAILFVALWWRPRRPLALPALIAGSAYVVARLLIHQATVMEVRREIRPDRLMVAPHPLDPTRWDVVAQIGDHYRYGRFSWRDRGLALAAHQIPVAKPSPEWEQARRDPSVQGFITWARFPWYEVEGNRVLIHDARYMTRAGRRGFGGVEVTLGERASRPATKPRSQTRSR